MMIVLVFFERCCGRVSGLDRVSWRLSHLELMLKQAREGETYRLAARVVVLAAAPGPLAHRAAPLLPPAAHDPLQLSPRSTSESRVAPLDEERRRRVRVAARREARA